MDNLNIKQVQLDPFLSQMMQQFASTDLRHEVILNALIDLLVDKKDEDGNPLITKEAIDQKAEELHKKLIEDAKIAKPANNSNIIVPGQ